MKKTERTATLGIAEEFRKMEVGDIVLFPVPKYNYNSVRNSPCTTLMPERIQGKRWTVRADFDNKCVRVTRTA